MLRLTLAYGISLVNMLAILSPGDVNQHGFTWQGLDRIDRQLACIGRRRVQQQEAQVDV